MKYSQSFIVISNIRSTFVDINLDKMMKKIFLKKKKGRLDLDEEVNVPTKEQEIKEKKHDEINKLCCGKLSVSSKLVQCIGCCELAFLMITLVLTIAHYARYASALVDRMDDILIVILVGDFIGFIVVILLFVGIRRKKLSLLKLNYISLTLASCLLLLSFVFIFTSVFGDFDETYFYGEQTPPIMITLGALWLIATPFAIFFGIVIRQYYKQEQENNRKIARMKKSSSKNHCTTETSLEEVGTNNFTNPKLNGPVANDFINDKIKSEMLNGGRVAQNKPTIISCNTPSPVINDNSINRVSTDRNDHVIDQTGIDSDNETISSGAEEKEETYKDLCEADNKSNSADEENDKEEGMPKNSKTEFPNAVLKNSDRIKWRPDLHEETSIVHENKTK